MPGSEIVAPDARGGAPDPAVPPPSPARGGAPPGARILSIGIASTGLLTFTYFAVASHVLDGIAYKRISVLWAIVFVVVSVIYRPIEQLLSRTIAERRSLGIQGRHPLRVAVGIQLGFAALFLAVALAVHGRIQAHVFSGSSALYWVLVVGVLAYAGSFFARGWLAGHQRFGLYGGLLLLESSSRLLFALAVAVSLAHGQTAVALGIAAGPFVSLLVVPVAFARGGRVAWRARDRTAEALVGVEVDGPGAEGASEAAGELSLRRGGSFAIAVLGIMLAEQSLLNGPVLIVDATAHNGALAGFVFNILLITRAPLQLFQAVQTSLLPHLTGLQTTDSAQAFDRTIKVTLVAIAAFAGAVALGLLAVGPQVMRLVFGNHFTYARGGLLLVGLGMGLHLTAGTLNQAALARRRTGLAAGAWLTAALAFVVWVVLPIVHGEVLRVEVGYFGATLLLSALLLALYRRPAAPAP